MRAATLLLLALLPASAAAHEVQHTVERGRAIAVRAFFADGEPLLYTEYEVYSPADREIPHQKGRTDRNGYLSFVPDAPGAWRVRVLDTSGHGLDVTVEAGGTGPAAGTTVAGRAWQRPAIGVVIIALIFLALHLYSRRQRQP